MGRLLATAYDECEKMAWEHKHCNDCVFVHSAGWGATKEMHCCYGNFRCVCKSTALELC
jgi:hypothetical protein